MKIFRTKLRAGRLLAGLICIIWLELSSGMAAAEGEKESRPLLMKPRRENLIFAAIGTAGVFGYRLWTKRTQRRKVAMASQSQDASPALVQDREQAA